MNIFCENPCVTCDPIPLGAEGIFPNPNSEANPFSNFSSEKPDEIIFVGRNYTPVIGEPPLGQPWTATGCVGVCFSTISQEDADLCAARQGVLCTPWPPITVVPPGQPPDICITNPELCPPTGPAVFASFPQLCTFQCQDGSFFNFTTVSGLFWELNQQLANDKAYSWACQKAAQNAICFGLLSQSGGCVGQTFSSSVSVSSADGRAVTFDIPIGALPPGVVMQSSTNGTTALLSGTPTSVGTYPFTLRATDSGGNSTQKAFTISIVEIANTSPLAGATLGAAYSVTLTGAGPVGTPTWAVTSGLLPPGLSLNTITGELFGTPTASGTYVFQIQMTTT